MKPRSPAEYISDIERRHNLSAETRSLGEHCSLEKGHPLHCESAVRTAPGEVVPVREGTGTSGIEGKGGRGKGASHGSNYGPSRDSY